MHFAPETISYETWCWIPEFAFKSACTSLHSHWEDLEGASGDGGGRGDQDGEDM